MGNKSSAKKTTELTDILDLINEIDVSSTDLAHSVDSIHNVADDFVYLLEEREKEIDFSDRDHLLQKMLSLYGTAIHLLMRIETGRQQNIHTAKCVARSLNSMKCKLEKLLKPKERSSSRLKLDAYLSAPEQGSYIASEENVERVRSIMVDSSNLRSIVEDLQIKVQQLEKEYAKTNDDLRTFNMEKTAKEIDVKKAEEGREKWYNFSSSSNNSKANENTANATLQSGEKNKEETAELKDEIKQLQREKETLKSEAARSCKKIEELDQHLLAVKKELDEAKRICLIYEENLRREKSSSEEKCRLISDMKMRILNIEKEKETLHEKTEEDANNLQVQLKSLEQINQSLQQDNDGLKLELKHLMSTKIFTVQIYIPSRGELISTIEENLMVLLKRKMSVDGIELKFIQCVKPSSIEAEKPLLILCINASRLGTDVSNVLQGIHGTSQMALLIFHHKDVHALPNQTSDRILTGPPFKALGGVFDMAFLSDKGIYSCGMNNNNIINVINFIKTKSIQMKECA